MEEGKAGERRAAVEMRKLFPHLYDKFSREQWAKLRANMPLEVSDEDLNELRGLNDPVSLDEVEEIYLPLGRLLNIHMSMASGLVRVKDAFLGRPSYRRHTSSRSPAASPWVKAPSLACSLKCSRAGPIIRRSN